MTPTGQKQNGCRCLTSSLFQTTQQMAFPLAAHACCRRAHCDAGSGSGLTRQSPNTGDESKPGRFVAPHPACSGNIQGYVRGRRGEGGQRASQVLVPWFRDSVNTRRDTHAHTLDRIGRLCWETSGMPTSTDASSSGGNLPLFFFPVHSLLKSMSLLLLLLLCFPSCTLWLSISA